MKASGNVFLNVRFIERQPFGFVPKVICVWPTFGCRRSLWQRSRRRGWPWVELPDAI